MNKKGLAFKFMAGFMFIGLIVLMGFILFFIVANHGTKKEQEFNFHRALLETNYQTRTTLMQEYQGKVLYQHILDTYNDQGLETAIQTTRDILTNNNPGTQWYVYISGSFLPDRRELRVLGTHMPDFLLPNPQGNDLRVKIKILREGDFELKAP